MTRETKSYQYLKALFGLQGKLIDDTYYSASAIAREIRFGVVEEQRAQAALSLYKSRGVLRSIELITGDNRSQTGYRIEHSEIGKVKQLIKSCHHFRRA